MLKWSSKFSKILFCFITFILVLLCLFSVGVCHSSVANAYSANNIDDGFNTTKFHVDMEVGKYRTIKVTETIDVKFLERRHGIYRFIPTAGKINLPNENGDFEVTDYELYVSNINVKNESSKISVVDNSNGTFKQIMIGDADRYVHGNKQYIITYTIELPLLEGFESDLLYYNIFPSEWENVIETASFNIRYDKDYQSKDITLLRGETKLVEGVDYAINSDKSITGSVTNYTYGEGLSIAHQLDKGYFEKNMLYVVLSIVALVISLVVLVIVVILFLKYGRDEKVTTVVTVMPPKGINSAEVGYLIDGVAQHKDIISLLFYWANQGYMAIEEVSEEEYILKKVKELKGRGYESTLFNSIFVAGDEVTLSSLEGNLYEAINLAQKMLPQKLELGKNLAIYDKKSLKARIKMGFLTLIPLVLTTFAVFMDARQGFMMSAILSVFCAVFGSVGIIVLDKIKNKKKLPYIVNGFMALIVMLMSLTAPTDKVVKGISCVSSILAMLCFVVSIFGLKRTNEYNKIKGELLGLKEYIEKVEKEQLEMYIKENPSYYFDILPYAYSLGVSSKWAKNFEGIAVEPASWYYSRRGIGVGDVMYLYGMNRCLNTTCRSYEKAHELAIAEKSKSFGSSGGGGSFGGGGFSGGGGFGGGGGGSW